MKSSLIARAKTDPTKVSDDFDFGKRLTEALERMKDLDMGLPGKVEENDFADLFLLNTLLPRSTILNEVHDTLNFDNPDQASYTSPTVYQGKTPSGDIEADVEMIRGHDEYVKWKVAFFHMYGLAYEFIQHMVDNEQFKRLFDLCNVRGTVQVQLPFASEAARKEMEYIRYTCDELLHAGGCDWTHPFISLRIEDLEMRLNNIQFGVDI